ncbi:oligosaccharide flippase family protein [Fodinibius sediminis]|uniref:Membrane protein involved in the export of O-antigen and teichoic acid n=1 Tax=Fodinibius sediminis TaxID=1214077 RepID=A0A521D8W4_9BACT|nr:oligosaccharide flippase family protein [Fodinibius sediminis]SMO68055.1 Membrane protein involved in the export of O-antigen and teichoic acid [Fodinibius sediminis]
MGEDLKKKSLSSIKLLALPLGVTYLIKFIQTPVLAIFLSPADFGIWGLANVLIKAMESLTEVGIQKLLIQRESIKKSFLRSIWGFMILRGLFITGVALAIVPYYASFVDSPEGKFIFTLAIIVPAIQSFTTPALYLSERDIEFKNIAIYDALGQILFFIIVVALAYVYQSVLAMVMALLIVEGFKVFMSYGFFGIPAWPRFPEWRYLKEIFHHGKHFFLISLGSFVTIQIDDLMVGKLLGSDILGFYLIGYTLINVIITIIRKLFGRVLFPYYTKLVAGDEQAHTKINRILEDQILLLCIVFTGLFMLTSPLINLFFDDRWVEAIPIIQILTFTGLMRGIGNIIVPLFLAEKKQNILAVGRIIEVILFVPFIYLFTKQFGVIGTSYSVGVIFFIALSYRIIMAYRMFSLEVFKSTAMGYVGTFSTFITFAFVSLLYLEHYFYLFEYAGAPLLLAAILFHFYRKGKTLSYFLKEYIQYG